ncbi:SET domain-containing protein [Fomitiporia mediterranea MF3/22]|uniref:SET domain-containing protein n=1 Tax=Fomitiporia mediterranea (strain MF3/22) TaxID=694068 RepID=UPI0004407E95|nr:SET domain-containing protein [Fomitiporia mediterranea MF3/22]EJC97972.1 SET domain-containing protein [Fomitiporia mediterranea MF3/22]
MPLSPPDDALKPILLALRAHNPTLGIAKLHTKLLTQHPEWAVSEKRIKKLLAQESRPGPPTRPTSQVIENLNVSRWTTKVKVVEYGSVKGKGLEATQEIKEGEDVWKEDPFVISPSWDIYDLQIASHACFHCTTPFNSSTLPHSLPCPSSTNPALSQNHPCPARFCNRLCITRAMSRQHPLLCPATNPASVPLLNFARSRGWLAAHAVAQCIARVLMAFEQGRKQDLEEDLRFIRSLAQMSMDERWKIIETSGMEPDHQTWKTAHTLTLQAFHEPSNPRDKKLLSKIIRKPLPEDLVKTLFDYDAFLHALSRMGLNLEAHGGLYILHSHMNHSCEPNISVRHFDQRTALSRITMRARRDIQPGEELTVAYVDPALLLSARRRALIPWAFGTCMCDRCVREQKEEGEKKEEKDQDTGELGEAQENGEAEKFPGLEEELKEGLGLL